MTELKRYMREDWQYEVANGDTVLGYEEWIEHKHEADGATNKARIVIVMDGGLIQHILGNTADVEIAMIDYDIEGADEDTLIDIPQTEQLFGAKEQAYCWTQAEPDEINPVRVDQLFEVISGTKVSQ
jgi:hypothetical protein